MGSLRALCVASGAILGLASYAHAADLMPPAPAMEPAPMAGPDFSGWYLRGDVGVGMNTGSIKAYDTPSPLIGAPADAFNQFYNTSLGSTSMIDAGIGYSVNNWLRFDVTGEYRGGGHLQALEQVAIPSQSYQNANWYRGTVSAFIAMANAYVDVGTWYGITPYVGGGVGFAHTMLSGLTDQGFTYPGNGQGFPTGGYFADGTSNNFAWALMAGLDYSVTQNLKLELGYRFLDYGKVKSGASNCFNGTGQGGGFSIANCGGSNHYGSTNQLMSSDVRVGMIWTIGGETPAPQPMAPLVRKY
jgi:opacity protein-like surface antigen